MVADLLVKFFRLQGLKVKWVMNITDIDDKTLKGAAEKGVSLGQYTKPFIKAFFEDLEALNISRADGYPRASEHFKEMWQLVEKLLEKDLAYKKEDGIYFDISKFKDYGKFAGLDLKGLKPGARVYQDLYDKESPADFALWKYDGGSDHPGWHLECSAMSVKYLGQPFDIHTGGVDLIFPHHQNEIAQTEAATGKPLARYWLHNEHLLVEGQKMAKSLGNYYTLKDITGKGYPPLVLRLLLVSTHYRSKLDFSFKALDGAKRTLDELRGFLSRAKDEENEKTEKLSSQAKGDFVKALENDLNMPEAMSVIFNYIKEVSKLSGPTGETKETLAYFDKVLGLDLVKEELKIPQKILELANKREEFRLKGDFDEADKIRNKIYDLGFTVEDTDAGPRVLTKPD